MDFNVLSRTQGRLRTTKGKTLRQQKIVRLVKSGSEKAEVDTEVEEHAYIHANYTRENENDYNFTNIAAEGHK